MARRRGLSSEDRALWRQVTRSVTPLDPERAETDLPDDAPAVPVKVRRPVTEPAPPPAPVAAAPPAVQTRPLSRQWDRSLRRGALQVEASLDLHGMTEQAAHAALVRFVAAARAARLRTVLVVTGKGRQGRGVLKAQLPRWLEEAGLRAAVLAFHPAHVRHGGAGAWYLVLRRDRDPGRPL